MIILLRKVLSWISELRLIFLPQFFYKRPSKQQQTTVECLIHLGWTKLKVLIALYFLFFRKGMCRDFWQWTIVCGHLSQAIKTSIHIWRHLKSPPGILLREQNLQTKAGLAIASFRIAQTETMLAIASWAFLSIKDSSMLTLHTSSKSSSFPTTSLVHEPWAS